MPDDMWFDDGPILTQLVYNKFGIVVVGAQHQHRVVNGTGRGGLKKKGL